MEIGQKRVMKEGYTYGVYFETHTHTHTQNKYIRHDFMDFLITLSVKPMISSKKKYFNQTFAEKGLTQIDHVSALSVENENNQNVNGKRKM